MTTSHVTSHLTRPRPDGIPAQDELAASTHEPSTHVGVDLLADVFEGTEDAPLPVARRDAGGNLLRLWPSPDDPRWAVDMTFYPDGTLMAVHSITPRDAEEADQAAA